MKQEGVCAACGRAFDDHQWFRPDGAPLERPMCVPVGYITRRKRPWPGLR